MRKNLIIIVIVVTIILLIITIKTKKHKNVEDNNINISTENNIDLYYEEQTGKYIIKDFTTGENIVEFNSQEEAEYELEFYKKHPDYRANPPVSSDAQEISLRIEN